MEPVGLRRRVGLLLEVGEPMPSDGGRLIRELGSSAPVEEPDVEDDKFIRKRSKRDAVASAPSSLAGPTSGRELAWKSGRWVFPFS